MTGILVIGKTGQVGIELPAALRGLGHVTALGRADMDLTDPDAIRSTIRAVKPDIIINAAGYTIVDKAEGEPELAMQVNATAPGIMAEEARRLGALLVHYSTDYVFDGTKATPYVEDDTPNPINTYGRSKLEGESAIAAAGCRHLILRASWIYSGHGTNFVLSMLKTARERKELFVVDDQIGSPSWARTLALTTAELLGKITPETPATGVYHLSAPDVVSRRDFAIKIIAMAQSISGESSGWAEIRRTTTANYPLPAARPLMATTSKEKIRRVFGIEMPGWETQIRDFLREHLNTPVNKYQP